MTFIAGSAIAGAAFASVTINESFTPATIVQGDTSTYKIVIYNDVVGTALSSASATALMGSNITINDVSSGSGLITNTCGGTVTASAGSNGAVVLTGGTIPAASDISTPGSCEIDISVTSTVSGNHTVTIPANTSPSSVQAGFEASQGGTTVYNSTSASATLLVSALSAPTGSKSFSPSPSYVGVATTLTITLHNPNSSSTMPLTSFTDSLPSGMEVASTPNASVSCSGTGYVNGTVSATAGATDVILTGGTIGQGGDCVISVDVVVPSISGTSQVLTNSVAAGAIGNSRGLTSGAFSKALTVNAPVSVSKSFSPTIIPVNQPSTMTIVVTNNGSVALTGTAFTDSLPTSTQVAATPNASVSCTSGVNGTVSASAGDTSVTLSGATVAAGGSCTVTVDVTATAEGVYTNQLPANAVTNDQSIGSPAASAQLTAYAELRVAKTVSPSSVAPGQWVTFSITIYNYSGSTVSNAAVTDTLPSITGGYQMVLEGTPPVTDTCGFTFDTSGSENNDGDSVLHGTNGTVPAGSGTSPGSCTVSFRARVPSDAPVSSVFANSLPTGAATGPGVTSTNTVAVNAAVVDAVVASKSFSPTSIYQGQTSTLTITVGNRYVSALGSINLTDNLPSGLTLAANPAATNTCGGTLTASPGDTKVVLSGGSIAARPTSSVASTCSITVKVTGTVLGTHTNTINRSDFTSDGGTIASAVSANLSITAGLSATKSFSPSSVSSGGVARATVHVTNQTPGTLTNVSINDTGLGSGLVVANPANATTSCGGSPVITANPGASVVRLDGVTLGASSSCDLSFDVLASGSGPWSNTIPAGNITSTEGAYNSAVVSATLTASTASLSLNKSFDPLIVTGNEPSVLTIDVVNSSSVAISNASFTDTFPTGIVVYSVPDAQTTCSGGTVAATAGGTQVSLTGATLAAGATCQVKVTVTSIAFLNLTNTIPAGAVTSQGGYTNAESTSATLSTLQGLGVSKGFDPAYVSASQTSLLKILLVNTYNPNIVNPTTLSGLTYTDNLPTGLVFATPANASTTCSGGTVYANTSTQQLTLTGATLAPGGNCEVDVYVTADTLGNYTNQLAEGSVTSDQGITNHVEAVATLYVVDAPTLTKSFEPTTVALGGTSQLIVTVSNPATTALTGVSLTDSLPQGLAVANPANTSTTCSGGVVSAVSGAAKVTLTGATVPAGGNCEFRVAVLTSTTGTLTNTIGAGAISSDQDLTNGNPAAADLTVLAAPTISKAFSPVQIDVDGTSTLTLTLGNSNATALTLSSALVDALPGNVVVAATPNVSKTCPGTVTATAGAVSIRYASGSTIPAGGCTISVDVTSSVTGGYTNTIAAGQLQTTEAGGNPEAAVATLGVGQAAAPTVSKAFSPVSIAKDGTSTLTITLGNTNTTALTLSSALVDTLPSNVVVADTPAIAGTCDTSAVTAVAGAGTVTYASGASIPVNGCTISVQVSSAVAGSYTNIIAAGALVTDEAGANPVAATAGLTVYAGNDPTVLKAFSPSTINPGGTSTLTITLGNTNSSAATLTADLVDTLPTDVVVANPAAIGGSCSTGSISAAAGGSTVSYLSGASIPVGGCTIQVNVTSSVSGGPYVNTIAAGALQTDLGSNGAAAQASLLVNPGQPPSVSKSFSPTSIGPGGTSTLTISLGNGNSAAATLTADLVDTLPGGVTVASPLTVAGTCPSAAVASVGGGTVSYPSGATIPAGGCSIQVLVTSSTAGTVTNTIAVGALQTDLGANAVATSADLEVLSASGVASISGTVFNDRNNNGLIDSGEEGIEGVEVRLSYVGTDGVVVLSTVTDASGHYSFTNLVPGTYTVTEIQPSGWDDGKDTAGSAGGTADNDVISSVVLTAGVDATEYNFGERAVNIPTLDARMLLALVALLIGSYAWGVRRTHRA